MYLCFEIEGTYVDFSICWFEDNWLLPLGTIFFFFFFFYVKAYLGINSMKLKQMAYCQSNEIWRNYVINQTAQIE